MPYKITSVTTKPDLSTPNFDEWLLTIPESAIAAFPDAAGKTPEQVIYESSTKLENPAEGFISQQSVPDDNELTWTWESVWRWKSDSVNARVKTNFIDGNVDNGITAASFLRRLYQTENGITVEHFYSNNGIIVEETFESNI